MQSIRNKNQSRILYYLWFVDINLVYLGFLQEQSKSDFEPLSMGSTGCWKIPNPTNSKYSVPPELRCGFEASCYHIHHQALPSYQYLPLGEPPPSRNNFFFSFFQQQRTYNNNYNLYKMSSIVSSALTAFHALSTPVQVRYRWGIFHDGSPW